VSEDIKNVTEEEGAQGASTPEPSAETKTAEKEEHMIPKSRFDEVLTAKKELEKTMASIQAQNDKAEADRLAEQGKFKDLWEKSQTEAQAARDELARLQRDALRRDIAQKAGYASLWNRISGDDEDTLMADMAALVAAIPAVKAPDIAGGTGTKARVTEGKTGELTKAERKALADQLGVQEKYIP